MAKRSTESQGAKAGRVARELGRKLEAASKAGDFDDHKLSAHEGYVQMMKESADKHTAAAAAGDHTKAADLTARAQYSHAEMLRSSAKADELRQKMGGDDRKRDDHGRFE